MKLNNRLYAVLLCAALPLTFLFTGCRQDLTEINVNPNEATGDKINPAYVLTSVLAGSANELAELSFTGSITARVIPEAMQYLQRDFLEYGVTNQFGWYTLSWDYRDLYRPLSNACYLESRAGANPDSLFLKGASLTMQAMWFGLQTSTWGDVPYSEAYKGIENLQPAFDAQIDVFKGILSDLEEANAALAKAGGVGSSVVAGADLLYGGDVLKWRQFANSLRLRFLMRLSEKAGDMSAAGVDVAAEFSKMVSNPSTYPLINSSANDAAIAFPGSNQGDAWPLGPLVTPTESEFYRVKAASTIVDFLKSHRDPRLTVWFRPVEVQTLVRDKGADVVIEKDAEGHVKRYIRSYKDGIDTSLYVGLKIALSNPDIYNDNNAAQRTEAGALDESIYRGGAANPFVSYLSPMYRTDTHPLVKSIFISAAEVYFTLAEAASRGWIGGSAADYYLQGVSASLDQYGVADGDPKVYDTATHRTVAFDRAAFLEKMKTEFNSASDKIEVIMQQKWLAAFTTMEGWFNWRRTGYPDLGPNILNGPQGEKIPVRYIYGDSELNYNTENTNTAISRLEPAVNDQWSKMWLIQGTGKPW